MMKQSTRDELAACLASAPPPDAPSGRIKAWLFTDQTNVAVSLGRLVEDDEKARAVLTEVAGRSWRWLADENGPVQRLWRSLRTVFEFAAAQGEGYAEAIDRHFKGILSQARDFLPPEAVAQLRDPQEVEGIGGRVLERVGQFLEWLHAPPVIPEDMLGPGPAARIPYRKQFADWISERVALGDPILVPEPALGDFVAFNVVNRLNMVARSTFPVRAGIPLPRGDSRVFPDATSPEDVVRDIRLAVWTCADAADRRNACALLQVYLSETALLDPDWSVLPAAVPDELPGADEPEWPVMTERKSASLRAVARRWKAGVGAWLLRRRYVHRELLGNRLETRPSDVVRTVTGGLEWLREQESVDAEPAPRKGKKGAARPTLLTFMEALSLINERNGPFYRIAKATLSDYLRGKVRWPGDLPRIEQKGEPGRNARIHPRKQVERFADAWKKRQQR